MDNSFFKPDSLRMISLNVRGVGNFRKRRAMFTWSRKQKADVIFLQETHSTKNCESQWKKEWGSLISFSHGTSNARGVAVLFNSKLDIVILQELSDSKGYRLVNVYGPNKDAEAVRFYQNLSLTLRQMKLHGDDNVIIGGDFRSHHGQEGRDFNPLTTCDQFY